MVFQGIFGSDLRKQLCKKGPQTDPKNLGGPIDLLSSVRPSVRMDSAGTAPYLFLIFGIKVSFYGIMSTMKPDFLKKIVGQKWRKRCNKYAFLSISWQPDHRLF